MVRPRVTMPRQCAPAYLRSETVRNSRMWELLARDEDDLTHEEQAELDGLLRWYIDCQ